MLAILFAACFPETTEPERPAGPALEKGVPIPPQAQAPVNLPASDNDAPVIRSVGLVPDKPTVDDLVEARIDVVDPEGDSLDIRYTWIVDGTAITGSVSPTYQPQKKHERVTLRLTVTAEGGTAEASSSEIEIQNRPPLMDTQPREVSRIDGFLLKAHDPDGDIIRWSIADGPEGMTVDSRGMLHYKGSEDEKGGDYLVKVSAEDGDYGYARLEMPLSITEGSKAKAEREKKKTERKAAHPKKGKGQ